MTEGMVRATLTLLVFLALTAIAATSGAQYRPGAWYLALSKPSWTPPAWLFPPVWAILYFMIAVAGWRVWRAEGMGFAVSIWIAALLLNAAWSYLMFGQHQIALAAVDVVALWLSILTFIVVAWPIDKLAAELFMPYLVWVSFAAVLNITILRLNT